MAWKQQKFSTAVLNQHKYIQSAKIEEISHWIGINMP
jgi:hypothetical protein